MSYRFPSEEQIQQQSKQNNLSGQAQNMQQQMLNMGNQIKQQANQLNEHMRSISFSNNTQNRPAYVYPMRKQYEQQQQLGEICFGKQQQKQSHAQLFKQKQVPIHQFQNNNQYNYEPQNNQKISEDQLLFGSPQKKNDFFKPFQQFRIKTQSSTFDDDEPLQQQFYQKSQSLQICEICNKTKELNHQCQDEYGFINCPFCSDEVVRKFLDDHLEDCTQHIEHKFKQLEMVEECSICLEDLQQNIVTLKCDHKFHTKCLNDWKKKQNECPVCRIKI